MLRGSALIESLRLIAASTILAATLCAGFADTKPHGILTLNGTVFYPVRYVTQTFGAAMDVNKITGAITVHGPDSTIVFTPNQKDARIRGEECEFEVAPFVRDGITYLQARVLIEELGLQDAFDNEASTNTLWRDVQGRQVRVVLHIERDVPPPPPPVGDPATYKRLSEAATTVQRQRCTPGYANPAWTPAEALNLADLESSIFILRGSIALVALGVRHHDASRDTSALIGLSSNVESRLRWIHWSDSERLRPANRHCIRAMAAFAESVKQFNRFKAYGQADMYARAVNCFGQGVNDLLAVPSDVAHAKNQYP